MSLYINRQHFKIKIVVGEPYITINRYTCVMNYLMNSVSKYSQIKHSSIQHGLFLFLFYHPMPSQGGMVRTSYFPLFVYLCGTSSNWISTLCINIDTTCIVNQLYVTQSIHLKLFSLLLSSYMFQHCWHLWGAYTKISIRTTAINSLK